MQNNLSINKVLRAFGALFFPQVCPGCLNQLELYEQHICTHCRFDLPLTNHFSLTINELNQQNSFDFDAPVFSLCFYHKNGLLSNIIKNFKYSKNIALGVFLSSWLGAELSRNHFFADLGGIIPVPMHKSRKRKRGFNQTEVMAKTIGKSLGVKVYPGLIARKKKTRMLSKLTSTERNKEIKNAFQISTTLDKKVPHWLLVDDIITTGATISACLQCLSAELSAKISVATLGYTQ